MSSNKKNGKRGPKKAVYKKKSGKKITTIGQLKKALGQEVKTADYAFTLGNIPSDGSTTTGIELLNALTTGAGFYNRVGRKVSLVSLQYHMLFNMKIPIPTGDNYFHGVKIRAWIVWDKSPNGVMPAFNKIFECRSQTGGVITTGAAPVTQWFPNMENRDRFTILRDCDIVMNPTAYPSGGTDHHIEYYADCNGFIDLKGRTTSFQKDSSPATIADVSTGGLYVVLRALKPWTTSPIINSSVQAAYRVRFSDQ